MTQCLLLICRCETMRRVNSIKIMFFFLGVKLCASTADITGRPVPAPGSETSIYFVCPNRQNLSFCQCTFAAKLVCRDFDVLINEHVTIVFHTYFYVRHNLLRFTACVNLCSVKWFCVAVSFMLLCCCPLSFCTVCLYGFVGVVAS
jgi:hypothetical protein